MLFQPLPGPVADREREDARRNPDRDTLELAAAPSQPYLEEFWQEKSRILLSEVR
jgi:hypothetical protein